MCSEVKITKLDLSKEDLNILFKYHYGLVVSIVGKITKYISSNSLIEYEDLIQLGSIGLIKALNRFDYSKGFTFSTYAVPNIRGEIYRYLRDDNSGKLTVSRGVKKLYGDYMNIKHVNPNYTDKEIAKELGVTLKELNSCKIANKNLMGLNYVINPSSEGDDITLEDKISSGECLEEEVLDSIYLNTMLEALKDRLPEREFKILIDYNMGEMTQKEIGAKLGISQVQVSRILASAKKVAFEVYEDYNKGNLNNNNKVKEKPKKEKEILKKDIKVKNKEKNKGEYVMSRKEEKATTKSIDEAFGTCTFKFNGVVDTDTVTPLIETIKTNLELAELSGKKLRINLELQNILMVD